MTLVPSGDNSWGKAGNHGREPKLIGGAGKKSVAVGEEDVFDEFC
jgi:hypothetical protein